MMLLSLSIASWTSLEHLVFRSLFLVHRSSLFLPHPFFFSFPFSHFFFMRSSGRSHEFANFHDSTLRLSHPPFMSRSLLFPVAASNFVCGAKSVTSLCRRIYRLRGLHPIRSIIHECASLHCAST